MKRYFTALSTLLMALMTFTSCMDQDTATSVNLSGEWEGDFGMYYEVCDRWGHPYRFNSYCTYLQFTPDYNYATQGSGYQVDFYADGPYERQCYSFNWEVRYGDIYLYYPYAPELNSVIYNYRMTSRNFSGKVGNSRYTFSMDKLTNYYAWSCPASGYCYYERQGWNSAPRRCASPDAETTEAPAAKPELEMSTIRRGSRFCE